jgi:hypothetical protein
MSTLWTNIWDFVWLFFWAFAFIAYLITLFNVVADLFRDDKLNGWWKALWLIFLVFLPFLTVLVYLIARGRSMAERRQRDAKRAEESATSYIREVAGTSPADEIAKAKSLLDAGVITADEYTALKTKALA